MSGTVHIVGAGLAGLSCAVRLADAGRKAVVYEAARMAGGRCRSYHDATLDMVIDNGNHLLLSGNRAALDYATRIGAAGALTSPKECVFDFYDARTKERWKLRPNDGRLPWWVLFADRRVPGTKPLDYLGAATLLRAKKGATIGQTMQCSGPLYERLWGPVLLSALNTHPPDASAELAGAVLRETLAAGGEACRPVVAHHGLGEAFVEPAVAHLEKKGVLVRFGARCREIGFDGDRAARLVFADESIELGAGDSVVVAAPAWAAAELLPGLGTPDDHRAILNVHFKIDPPKGQPLLLGMIGTLTEWLFAFEGRLSVTISGADRLMDRPREELAAAIWAEVAEASGIDAPLPVWQIVKEKRATFAATPAQEARRPGPRTRWDNLLLAGDWTATGLPATIEGTIRSGYRAAELLGA